MNWYTEVLRKYAVFSGRARRREYWMFVLFNALIGIVLSVLDNALGLDNADGGGVLQSIYGLAIFIPSLAVGVRRLHDTNRSGWWLLLWLIPVVGWIIMIVWLATAGQIGPNQYGPDPKTLPEPPMPGSASTAFSGNAPAGWYPDPAGRHELRYWDSIGWTEHVSDKGITSKDPINS